MRRTETSSQPFPEDLLADLRKPQEGKPLEARVFASVVNFSQVFKFDHEIAGLIANLLRKVKYRLNLGSDTEISFSLIMGLASIAASARHSELADEVRILARVLRRRGDVSAGAENQMRIALLACASRAFRIGARQWANGCLKSPTKTLTGRERHGFARTYAGSVLRFRSFGNTCRRSMRLWLQSQTKLQNLVPLIQYRETLPPDFSSD